MAARRGRGGEMDEWDTTIGSKAYYMNVVLREATVPLTVVEIMEEVRRRGYPEFGAPQSHLRRLEGKDPKRPTAYVQRIGNRWTPILSSRVPAQLANVTTRNPHERMVISTSSVVEDIEAAFTNASLQPTTKKSLIEARLGQGKFREAVLTAWGSKCAVTGSTTVAAIRASHIKPWRDSTDSERLDPENGIPLVASLDALFDRGLISVDDSGMVLISNQLSADERLLFGLQNACLRCTPPERTGELLAIHRKRHGFTQ